MSFGLYNEEQDQILMSSIHFIPEFDSAKRARRIVGYSRNFQARAASTPLTQRRWTRHRRVPTALGQS